MTKFKRFIPLLFIIGTTLTGCGEEKEVIEKTTLLEMNALLQGSLYKTEINNSSKATFSENYTKDDSSIQEENETWNIYSNETAGIEGNKKITYPKTNSVVEDNYNKIVKRIKYSNADIIYFVTDYEDGTKRTDWADKGDFLPVVKTGSEDYNGVQYLLESSVTGQLSKQVSLIAAQFIQSQFTSNANLQSTIPQGYKSTLGNETKYYIEPFSYSYKEDNITTSIKVSFEFVTKDSKLISFKSNYEQIDTNSDDIEDNYTVKDENTYEVFYEERTQAPQSLINPEDYFIQEVSEVEAYYYDEKGKEVIISLDEIPTNTYIHFKAKNYVPTKSIDIDLYATEDASSSNEKVMIIDGTSFHSEKSGTTTIKAYTATGVEVSFDITVVPVPLKAISYTDTYSDIENSNGVKYVYSGMTYNKITVTLSPSDAEKEDIYFVVDKPELVTITPTIESTVISYTYEISSAAKAGDSFTVTFTSKAFPDIKKEVTYVVKEAITGEAITSYLTSHTYKWTHLYSNTTGTLTFIDSTTGKIEYSNGDVTTFNYTINGKKINITITSENPLRDYNGEGEIMLDLSVIILGDGINVNDKFVVQ